MRRPIFVDHTGRRRRAAIVLGSGLGVLLVVGLIMLTAGLLTGAPVPLPGWPDAGQKDPAGVTQTQPPAVRPEPTLPDPTDTTTAPATTPSPTGPGNGNGNGNGNGHGRPTKSPGKPQ